MNSQITFTYYRSADNSIFDFTSIWEHPRMAFSYLNIIILAPAVMLAYTAAPYYYVSIVNPNSSVVIFTVTYIFSASGYTFVVSRIRSRPNFGDWYIKVVY